MVDAQFCTILCTSAFSLLRSFYIYRSEMGSWDSTDLVCLDWSSVTGISVLRIPDKCEEWKKCSGRPFYSGKREETGSHVREHFWFCLFWSFWVQFVLLKTKHIYRPFTHHKRCCFEILYNGSQVTFIVRPKHMFHRIKSFRVSDCWLNFYFWVSL